MANPSKTLNSILLVIDRDVKRIKKLGRLEKLDPVDALTLSRYVSSLSNVISEKEKEDKKAINAANKLSVDELYALYKGEKS